MQTTVLRRSRIMLVAPFAAVVVLAALWTVLWFQAAHTAEATVSAWMAREARAGRVYDCAERTTGGYPFRIEQRCTGVRIELRMFDPPLELKARELVAVAQVYQPTLIIAEARGPASVAESGRTVAMANWRLAQASLRGRPAAPERVSLVLDRPELAGTGEATAGALVKADHFEFHVRRDPTGKGKNTGFDFAVRLTGATWPASQYLAQPVDAELVALLHGLDSLAPRPLKARLRELQAAGAKLEVTEARLRQGDAVAAAKGELTLSETGHLNGMLTVTMAGFEGFVQQLAEGTDKSKSQAGMLAGLGLALLGRPAEIDGKQAVALPLRFGDNGAFLGPLPLGRLPPLY